LQLLKLLRNQTSGVPATGREREYHVVVAAHLHVSLHLFISMEEREMHYCIQMRECVPLYSDLAWMKL
jgi:hypothetical protein